jgi:hypothetical protein
VRSSGPSDRTSKDTAKSGQNWALTWHLQANTNLTQQVHDLTEKVQVLTEHLCNTSGIG